MPCYKQDHNTTLYKIPLYFLQIGNFIFCSVPGMVCQIKGPLQLSCYIWPSFGTASTTMDEMAFFLATEYMMVGWGHGPMCC